jgi:hypothetical protein
VVRSRIKCFRFHVRLMAKTTAVLSCFRDRECIYFAAFIAGRHEYFEAMPQVVLRFLSEAA